MNKYIIVGKAASGKDWMQKRMVEKGYARMKQYTTRDIRDNESGDEYHFISEEEYHKMEGSCRFVSSNFYAIGWYGIDVWELRASDVAILSPANVKDIFSEKPDYREDFTIIYLDIPVDVRRERLSKRYINKVGDDNERRIAADERDFAEFTDWDIRLTTVEEVDEFINNLSPIPTNPQ